MKISLKHLSIKYTGFPFSQGQIATVITSLLFGNKSGYDKSLIHITENQDWIENKEFDLEIKVNGVDADVLDVIDKLEKNLSHKENRYTEAVKELYDKNKPLHKLIKIYDTITMMNGHLVSINRNLQKNNVNNQKILSQLEWFDTKLKEIQEAVNRLENNENILNNSL